MTYYCVLNTLGIKLKQHQLEQIPTPRFELFAHVTMKTTQVGALLGGLVVAPVACLAKKDYRKDALVEKSHHFGVRGAQIGALMGPLLYGFWSMQVKADTEAIRDRCYRLRNNKGQVFSDRMCLLGLAAGAGVAKYLGEEVGRGMFFGFTGGLLTAGIINTVASYM